MVRVLIVDDGGWVRRRMRRLIEFSLDLTVIGGAAIARSSSRPALGLLPDVVILDPWCHTPRTAWDSFGSYGAGAACSRFSITSQVGPEALAAGAYAFLEKDGRHAEALVDMIRAAHGNRPRPGAGCGVCLRRRRPRRARLIC